MRDDEIRSRSVTSTDIGAIYGVDPWKTLWSAIAHKRRMLAATPPSLRMLAGKYFERGIAEWYSDLCGEPFEWFDQTVCQPVESWRVTTPDVLQRERRRGWEIKLVSWDQRGEWGPYPEDVPDHYQFQVVWHMAVMEYDSWTVVARMGDDAPV